LAGCTWPIPDLATIVTGTGSARPASGLGTLRFDGKAAINVSGWDACNIISGSVVVTPADFTSRVWPTGWLGVP